MNQQKIVNCKSGGHFKKVNLICNLVVCAIKMNTVIHIQKAEVKELQEGSMALGAEGPDEGKSCIVTFIQMNRAKCLTIFPRDVSKYNYTFPGEGAQELIGCQGNYNSLI